VIVPSRTSPPFGSTFTVTVPLPEPLDPAVTVIHDAVLSAVHPHAGELAATATLIGPPTAGLDAAAGVTVNRHGAASCVMSAVASFTVTTPWRGDGSTLPSTRYDNAASPCPLGDDISEIHDVDVDADHVQSRLVLIVSVPAAPVAGTEVIELPTDTEHFESLGDVTEIEDDPQAEAKYARAIDQSRLAAKDERCRAPMRAAPQCKRFARASVLIR
jgi:hypothetical protein